MRTCKNCLHYDACHLEKSETRYENSGCSVFADKSKCIYLPCGIGDKVWIVYSPKSPANPSNKGKWFLHEDGVQRIICGVKGISIETWNIGTIPQSKFGSILFFTREEAEQVLKERQVKQ